MPPVSWTSLLCAAALVLSGGIVAGCGDPEEGEPIREGLAVELGGLEYNVFITRQLNLEIPPDEAYYQGPAAKPGFAFYGVFLEVCNRGKKGTHRSTSEFRIVDSQGEDFPPRPLSARNAFAYHARTLAPSECIPSKGSVAQLGPTAGAMLLFDLPLGATENRPLELEIEGPYDREKGKHEEVKVELDF
jgi:hypothetical protein